jgi:hypothetical protein
VTLGVVDNSISTAANDNSISTAANDNKIVADNLYLCGFGIPE